MLDIYLTAELVLNTEDLKNLLSSINELIKIDNSLGDLYSKNKDFSKAVKYYKNVLIRCSQVISIYSKYQQFAITDLQEIKQNFENKIQIIKSCLSDSLFHLGEDFLGKKEWESAINSYKDALLFKVNDYLIYYKIALCFKYLQEFNLAIDYLKKSLELNHSYDESYREIGDIFSFYIRDYFKALENYEKYILLNNGNYLVFSMAGYLYHKTGNAKKAYDYFKKSVEIKPDYQSGVSNIIYVTNRIPEYNQEDIFNITKNYINNYLKEINFQNKEIFVHKGNFTEKKKLNLGYISGDFYDHVAMRYILPLLTSHNRDKFNISCYSNAQQPDQVTARCRELSDNFKEIKALNDREAAQLIFDDKIDILIDLSGHTSYNRVFVLAYKPAPIQVTYIGYPNTTGLETVDYFLSNKILNKEDEEQFYSEKIYFLDSVSHCFEFPHDYFIPPIKKLPAKENGYITFGSFNDLAKINEKVIKVWSVILKKIPSAKLLIFRENIVEELIFKQFAEYGIERERLILRKDFSLQIYEEIYNQIDIHLDTFPYGAVTVVFDSLIMGVPLITLYGKTFAGRAAANIYSNIDLKELIAQTEEKYIEIAVSLANDIKRLEELRNDLRVKLQNSDFFNYKLVTASLEKAFINMWQSFCIETNKLFEKY